MSMRHGEQILVALTAAAAIAFSSVTLSALWYLWRHPVRWNIRPTATGLTARLGEWTAEVDARAGRAEQIILWR